MIKTCFLALTLIISIASVAQENTRTVYFTTSDVTAKERYYTGVADSYLKCLTEKNLEGILALYAEDATLEDPVGSKIIKGIDAIKKFYSGAVQMDLTLTRTGPARIAANEMAFPFQLRMEVDGKPTITDIIDVFRFDEDGKIVSMRAFWGPGNRRDAKE